jgi:hypothetical protein
VPPEVTTGRVVVVLGGDVVVVGGIVVGATGTVVAGPWEGSGGGLVGEVVGGTVVVGGAGF